MARWIQVNGELVPVGPNHRQPKREAPHIQPDTPDYESPITGLIVHGRKGRREDLKRHGCRPYEGRQQEEREAARQRAYNEQRDDARLEVAARRAFYELDPRKRRMLENS